MHKFVIFVIVILSLLSLKSVGFYTTSHTEIDFAIEQFQGNAHTCSPEVKIHVKKLGVENVVSSCIVAKKPLKANCSYSKLTDSETTLKPACIKGDNPRWILALYAKHTLFRLPKIVLVNETIGE